MFVTNIRYGELPVRKVYLGSKLVWQCVDVFGDAKSFSHTKAYFYTTSVVEMSGLSRSLFKDNAESRLLELIVMNGESESQSYTDSTIRLFELLLLHGVSNSKSSVESYSLIRNANVISGMSEEISAENAMVRLLFVDDISSLATTNNDTSASCRTYILQTINGKNKFKFYTNSYCDVGSSIFASSNATIKFGTDAKVGSDVLLKLQVINNINSYSDTLLRTCDVIFVNGNVDVKSGANALCKLIDTCLIGGCEKSTSYMDGSVILNDIVSANSDTAQYINGNGALMNMWYIPVGDGVPLPENEDIDITQNGNKLEVRQAYQIYIDNENGILEVI
jgi:hypothetical protein